MPTKKGIEKCCESFLIGRYPGIPQSAPLFKQKKTHTFLAVVIFWEFAEPSKWIRAQIETKISHQKKEI